MSVTSRIGRLLGALSTLSGILYLIEVSISQFPILGVYLNLILPLVYVGILSFPAYLLWSVIGKIMLRRIEGVQAHIFFPEGIPDEDKTLQYHKKHFHHRLIVNHKTRQAKAYYVPVDSFAWRLISKFTDLWVSESDPQPFDYQFTQKWCDEKAYKLVSKSPDKKELLEKENSP